MSPVPVPGPAVQRVGSGMRHPWVLVLLLSAANSRPLDICDNGKSFLEVDLPSPEAYQCPGPHWPLSDKPASHICMGKPIKYNETIPNSGRHRPHWAHYGEYLYCPPQRWVHNLEHGGGAFLYHPCAPPSLRASLSALARSCLFKHVVTPFPGLTRARPLALAAWGRTLEMSHVTLMEAADWLRSSVNRAHESEMREDGLYNFLLIRGSKVVSDENDKDVCPRGEVQNANRVSEIPDGCVSVFCVSEVIKKRLKRGGKRKRRVYKSRKGEEEEEKRVLLRAFSSEESD
ncbi:UNVERIFIED_CONTAM: hypothetical protein FKN15_021806 [Acipenser sinensis]